VYTISIQEYIRLHYYDQCGDVPNIDRQWSHCSAYFPRLKTALAIGYKLNYPWRVWSDVAATQNRLGSSQATLKTAPTTLLTTPILLSSTPDAVMGTALHAIVSKTFIPQQLHHVRPPLSCILRNQSIGYIESRSRLFVASSF